jgi:sugar lactone lactonase YvrE/enterochelin esterase-like enzyme
MLFPNYRKRNPVNHEGVPVKLAFRSQAHSVGRIAACSLMWVLASAMAWAQQTPATPEPVGQRVQIPDLPFSNNYPLTEDSKPHEGVPAGMEFQFQLANSKIFPGTTRTIKVYVPAEYKGDKPACVMVALDGLGAQVHWALDNLIAQHAMPVTIAIGVQPGSIAAADGSKAVRYDRSFEFDNLSGHLAAFLIDEVIPAVEHQTLKDGRVIHISSDPNDRGISGGSTGGIGAFTVAWQRPDSFRRVFTSIGTFVGMRGGEQYYVLVRKTEPKPIRIFMQDGVHDACCGGVMGDWWMSNETMERALEYAGYDVQHVWGQGGHNGSQAASLFPEVMRWLWRDWPAPITAQPPGNPALKQVLVEGEGWNVAINGCTGALKLAANSHGRIYFPSATQEGITEISATAPMNTVCTGANDVQAFAFGPDDATYIAKGGKEGGITKQLAGSKPAQVATWNGTVGLAVRNNGDAYFITSAAAPDTGSDVWLVHPNGNKVKAAEGIPSASGLAFSPDGAWAMVTRSTSHLSYSYRVLSDGTLDSGEPFFSLYSPTWDDGSGARSVAMDREGRAYVATTMGVQICDHNGRVTGILPLPGNQPAESLSFGGEDFKTLYVYSGGKVYTRRMKVAGAFPAGPAIAVPDWRAG